MSSKQRVFLGILALLMALSVSVVQGQREQRRNNCPVTSDDIMGQAFGSTAGAEGETDTGGLTPEGEDIEASDLAMNAAWIMASLPYSGIGQERVAILVMDDFSSRRDAAELSHGWLVYEVFESLIANLPAEARGSIRLATVNIADQAGFSADLIVPRLQETLDTLAREGVQRFILNMSFVFIPCEDRSLGFNYNDFRQRRSQQPARSLIEETGGNRDYVLSVLSDARVAYLAPTRLDTNRESRLAPQAEGRSRLEQELAIAERSYPTPAAGSEVPSFNVRDLAVLRLFANRQLEQDPLRNFLAQTPYQIVPVASAGNFKQQQPFYPARWPEVISVSADEGNDLRFWLNSNDGEITVPGAWHLFSDDVYRAGTSFAAPVLSVLLALDWTQTTPTCALVNRRPELAHARFENVLLTQAVEDFCM